MVSQLMRGLGLLVLAGLSSETVTAQTSVSYGGSFTTLSSSNEDRLHANDTLHVRIVQINGGSEPVAAMLACEITLETDLELERLAPECGVPATPLLPGDSAWADLRAVVLSPPGRYRLAWRNAVAGANGPVTVRAPWARRVRAQPRRLPFRTVIRGEGAERLAARDVGEVVRWGLSAGDPDAVVFPVSEVAAERMASFAPVIVVTFDIDENGTLEFSRCWNGGSAAGTSLPCGLVASGRYGSTLALGAAMYRLLLSEGQSFRRSVR